MDEKTEELRDIFMDVADEETVTERQTEARGSLDERDEETVRGRLRDTIERMRDREAFRTDFETETYVDLVYGFYDGDDDATLASDLDLSEADAFAARADCHLLRDDDLDAPVDHEALADTLAEQDDRPVEDHLVEVDGDRLAAIAAALDVPESDLRRYRRALVARNDALRVSHRYGDQFEEILTDADLSGSLTEGVTRDGLEEATEDIETDLSL
ncbi:MAG: conditioned medium-induced protein 4 [Haloarculaceae archaeon]